MFESTEPCGCPAPEVAALAADLRARCGVLDPFAIWSLDDRELLNLAPFRGVPGLVGALSMFASKPSRRRLTPDGVDEVLIRFAVWIRKPKTADTLARSIVVGMEKGIPFEAAACKRFQDELRRLASRNTLSVLPKIRLDALVGTRLEPRRERDEEVVDAA